MTLQAKPQAQCKVCDRAYLRFRTMQAVCSATCARKSVNADKKAEAEQTRARRVALKSLGELANEAQCEFNRYVRRRDAAEGCISCDKPASWPGVWHASHLRGRKAAGCIRFHLWNVHKSCSQCNHFESGNIAEYKPRVIEKIGADKVDWLYTQNHVVKYDRDYLKRLKRVFARKANRLEKRNEKLHH